MVRGYIGVKGRDRKVRVPAEELVIGVGLLAPMDETARVRRGWVRCVNPSGDRMCDFLSVQVSS